MAVLLERVLADQIALVARGAGAGDEHDRLARGCRRVDRAVQGRREVGLRHRELWTAGARRGGQRQGGESEQRCEPAGHGRSSMATVYAGSMAEPHSPEAVSSRIAQIRDGLTLLADYL